MFSRFSSSKKYFDYASITPLDNRVVKVMHAITSKNWQNPSSLYASGVVASKLLDQARQETAEFLSGSSLHSVHSDEVVFTSGGTESDNLAILGTISAWKRKTALSGKDTKPVVISSVIEHPAVKKTLEYLHVKGDIEVIFVSVLKGGCIDMQEFKEVLFSYEDVVLVSIMLVNNEIGTIQPISEIAGLIRKYRKEKNTQYPYFHTDACQAPVYIDMRIDKLGVDLLSLDGGKVYGPRGVGCLYKKRNVEIDKIYHGGAQEMDMRPGTENLPAIVGFAKALQICADERGREVVRISKMQKYMFDTVPDCCHINGSTEKDARIINNVNICIPKKDSEFLLFKLDVAGFEVSTGTTCQNKQEESRSYVVDALGEDCGASSLRISFGRFTKFSDVKKLSAVLKKVIKG